MFDFSMMKSNGNMFESLESYRSQKTIVKVFNLPGSA